MQDVHHENQSIFFLAVMLSASKLYLSAGVHKPDTDNHSIASEFSRKPPLPLPRNLFLLQPTEPLLLFLPPSSPFNRVIRSCIKLIQTGTLSHIQYIQTHRSFLLQRVTDSEQLDIDLYKYLNNNVQWWYTVIMVNR